MQIMFQLNELEGKVTPIKVANALIEAIDTCKDFPENGLKELASYLAVYNRYMGEREKEKESKGASFRW